MKGLIHIYKYEGIFIRIVSAKKITLPSDIKKIIELENKTRDTQNKLESKLDERSYYTVFPHMDCTFVK